MLRGFLLLLLIALVVGIPLWILARFSRQFPPALSREGYASGVGGPILLFLLGQIAWMLRELWDTAFMSTELFFALARTPDALITGAMALVPHFISIGLGVWLIWSVVVYRTPKVVLTVILGLWIMGPGVALVQGWYFALLLTTEAQMQFFGWAIGWTIYWVVSPRVALTYGTVRGRRIVLGQVKKGWL